MFILDIVMLSYLFFNPFPPNKTETNIYVNQTEALKIVRNHKLSFNDLSIVINQI